MGYMGVNWIKLSYEYGSEPSQHTKDGEFLQ
jgi:hypothetical protein